MRRYDLIAFDLDGTLVGTERAYSPRVLAALERARAAGVVLALNTGRPCNGCWAFLPPLGLTTPHAFCGGAEVRIPVEPAPVWHRAVPPETARRVVAACRAAGIHIEVYTPAGHAVERRTPLARWHEELLGIEAAEADLNGVISSGPVTKLLVISESPQERERVRRLLAGQEGIVIGEATTRERPELTFFNVTAPGASKGDALAALARHLNIPRERVVAVGDGIVDIAMFEKSGLAVAMGNALPVVQAAAHMVVPPVHEDGVAELIERYILE
jgi:Cof subfamily protein (haloacid dehalogenase superfamily)